MQAMYILLADDSKSTALPVIAYLEQQGYHVTHVRDGRAAVAAYRVEQPQRVLMDGIASIAGEYS